MICYNGMTVLDGVTHVASHFTDSEIASVTSFSDLHGLRDANMTLPFPEDCNDVKWLAFANAVIATFDQKLQLGELEMSR